VSYNLDSSFLKFMVMDSNATQLSGADRGKICRMREQYAPPENVALNTGINTFH
jgi:hypothetical protein